MAKKEKMVIFTRTFDFLDWLLPMTADLWDQLQLPPSPREKAVGFFQAETRRVSAVYPAAIGCRFRPAGAPGDDR